MRTGACNPGYPIAFDMLTRGRAALVRGDFNSANILLADGIASLGSRYEWHAQGEHWTQDDTGEANGVALGRDLNGDAKGAAVLRESILQDRLDIYRRFHDPKCIVL